MNPAVVFVSIRRCLLAIVLSWALAAAGSEDLHVETLIKPGYVPGSDARTDERGLWMEMAEAEVDLQRSPLLVSDTSLDRMVRELACHVAGDYCNDIRVYVIRNPTFNASMAPNGTMIVHTGLIVRMRSADELAAVLGHELAHYTQSHSLHRLRAAKSRLTAGMLFTLGLAAGGVSSGGIPEIIAIASVMGYTRDQESEADEIGTRLLHDAGFDPQAAAEVWLNLEDEELAASVKHPKGPLFLSSHPTPERRSRNLAAVADAMPAPDPARPDLNASFKAALVEHYELLMDGQIKQRDVGRMRVLLDRHAEIDIGGAQIAYYRGEALRFDERFDAAIMAYREATHGANPVTRAHKQLGYLLSKLGEDEQARMHFKKYLEYHPDSSDREIIEFQMDGGWM